MAQPQTTFQAQPEAGSVHALLAAFELTLADVVEATLEEGLDLVCAPPAVRVTVAETWRDRIAFAAAESMSERLSRRAMHGDTTLLDRAKLRRHLREYVPLVAAEARVAMASTRHTEFAAD